MARRNATAREGREGGREEDRKADEYFVFIFSLFALSWLILFVRLRCFVVKREDRSAGGS